MDKIVIKNTDNKRGLWLLYNDYIKQTDNPLAFETFKIRLRKGQSPYRQREWKTGFTHKTKEEKKEYFREKMRELRNNRLNWELYNIRISRYGPTEKEIFTEEDFKYIKSIPDYEQNTTTPSR